ncbi:MAG: molybdopterin molybdotransferase MoeA [Elusimicrobia bacterium]|nr:molybdopterin molybdotransferase MoeA [Elusimicrobiota bacterium]
MLAPEKALRSILENVPILPPEPTALSDCAGRILAEDIRAREDLPPFDNSAMDGFAVITEECRGASQRTPVRLKVKKTLRAGSLAETELRPGEAIRIMTGAPLPGGADAVVMKEATSCEEPATVRILQAPELGEHIRRHGEDVGAGDLILTKGTRIRPYEIALLAAQGILRVRVVRRARVALLATGDELLEPSRPLTPGKIRNSNGFALAAALSRWNISCVYAGIVPDDPVLMRKALEKSISEADVLLVSGGVSAGDFDYTKTLLEALGLRTVFWKVAIKPGKPLLFGLWRGKPVFGLPGNPVAAMVCLEEFVRPALEKMQGFSPAYPSYHLRGRLENDYPKDKLRQQYLFCEVSEGPKGFQVRLIRPQGSAMLGMACKANALALGPIGVGLLRRSTEISFRWLK